MGAEATKTTNRHEDNLGKATPGTKDVDSYSFDCPDCHTVQPISVESNQKHIQCIQCHKKFDVIKLLGDAETKVDPSKKDKPPDTKLKDDPNKKTPPEPPRPPANKKDVPRDTYGKANLPDDPTPLVEAAIGLLKEHESGLLPCVENREALRRLELGLQWLTRRTSLREEQGVEGTQKAHRSSL